MTSTNEKPAEEPRLTGEALQELLKKAVQGDRSVLPTLRALLDNNKPLWQHYGDLGRQLEGRLIALASGNDLLLAESLTRELAEMKAELEGPAPTPLERHLVQTVCATWVEMECLTLRASQQLGVASQHTRFLADRQDAANRRHLSAVKALATVRKHLKSQLAGPASVRLSGSKPDGAGDRTEYETVP